ncbi:hypothetical protein QBC46DRAFT_397523 [Diplogelasinospora grovesii]|uniref:Uncharacterized protein n=1 Tax=Diplogelasinospora grovesii TaxID=303347 RepID=A0AAN6MXQ2_9PEZI|nr:hypothetical protein QBC46DRAFT_397523 [Diplogelasinospora grovesii]
MVLAVGTIAGPAIIGTVAIEAAFFGASSAIASGVSTAAAGTTVAAAASNIGGAAIAGALVAGEAGAVAGAVTAAAAPVAAGAIQATITAATLAGPVGWAIVGADGYTWDCWKPVVMDDTVKPSSGIALRDLYNHPNLRWMVMDGDDFVAENVHDEQFRISPVEINGTLAFHATSINLSHLR